MRLPQGWQVLWQEGLGSDLPVEVGDLLNNPLDGAHQHSLRGLRVPPLRQLLLQLGACSSVRNALAAHHGTASQAM
jgi:hypothetical protein